MAELKRTPLYEMHKKYGGRIVDFGGWELPVQYEGIIKEHEKVRTSAGLFDVSHMGEIIVRGKEALSFIQSLVTNDLSKIKDGQIQYSPICYESGGCVDDLIVYRYSENYFFIVVNASNTDKDYDWFCQCAKQQPAPAGLTIENASAKIAQLAIQGPKAKEILQKLTDFDLDQLDYFHFNPDVVIDGIDCIVSRSGYTGEDGFEIYLMNENAVQLWEAILLAGGDQIAPIGLGARDSLRFEAKLPLYGQEISQEISPVEAGLGIFVRPEKESPFYGKEELFKQKQPGGLSRKLCEFELLERGVPRSHYEVAVDDKIVGFVTTGMFAPTLKKYIGLALLPIEFSEPGTKIQIMIRNKPVLAEVKKGIFYNKKNRHK